MGRAQTESDVDTRGDHRVILLIGQFGQVFGLGSYACRYLHRLAAGIRIGQQLRLHVLGTDMRTMPPDDLALPPGR